MKTIILTGGGSGGHIAPIRAIAPELLKTKKLIWLGSSRFEESAAADLGIPFKKICSGKVRRGLNIKNILLNIFDAFRVKYSGWQSLFFLLKNKPEKVFSTGGFVSVPVVIAACFLRIPIVIHEQTIGFGLANKIGGFCASKILLAFEESKQYILEKHHSKIEVVGNPIRADLMNGSFENLQKFLGIDLNEEKSILYITGGGQGSKLINEVVFESLPELTKEYYVIHQAGKTGIEKAKEFQTSIRANASLKNNENISYFPFEFIENELADIYASVDIVLARSGAGTVNELNYFGIYSIFVPLQPVQDDEQMKNAEWFLKGNGGKIIIQNSFNKESLKNTLKWIDIQELSRCKNKALKGNSSAESILRELLN